MSCPACGCVDWKLASLVHAEGLTSNVASTTGAGLVFGASGVGVMVGGASTIGMAQSTLSLRAAPPAEETSLYEKIAIPILLVNLMGWLTLYTYVSEFSLVGIIVGLAMSAAGLYLVRVGVRDMQKHSRAYTNSLEQWRQIQMCTRCGRFYKPSARVGPSEGRVEIDKARDIAALRSAVTTPLAVAGPSTVLSSNDQPVTSKETKYMTQAEYEAAYRAWRFDPFRFLPDISRRPTAGSDLYAYTDAWLEFSGLFEGKTISRFLAVEVAGQHAISYNLRKENFTVTHIGPSILGEKDKIGLTERGIAHFRERRNLSSRWYVNPIEARSWVKFFATGAGSRADTIKAISEDANGSAE